ncbi:L,D-transpeptidase [Flavobacterium sp. F-380]|uniref:L,D-transpeptidase n=1 Tax=Flavobacterium kayseriense TaxID=2764714 RepID=A0ABR7J6S4_9FLAO|nr:L,D-transpeptidase [Flavobacterium kayseriense]MBC5841226.1 L,D-transpeptidase [Flavobacterium kayseriense]MBC5847754.1 L,D-transpeptidase [Flavobacterium kayseriense]
MKKIHLLALGFAITTFVSCKQEVAKGTVETTAPTKVIERHEPKEVSYTVVSTKEWLTKNEADSTSLRIAYATNRTDAENLKKMDSIIVPKDLSGDIEFYLPFPLEVAALKEVNKIILFSYPSQTFAAYENGQLVRTGPTNMGREKDQTPTGLFFTNWKAEETTSTFNDEWDLKWNYNIANKLGVGFHQYALPGYPASHSCLRLQERDARYLYDWADQWVLADSETVKVKGTPVVVFGTYDFKASKPWLELTSDPKALTLSEEDVKQTVQPHLSSIMKEQKNKEANKA